MDLLTWAIIALVVAVVAGVFGFTGIARGAAQISKILFGIFLIGAVILLIMFVLGIGAVA